MGDFALDLNTSNAWGTTGYDATAFGGKHGFVLQNDAFAADFTSVQSLDPGSGWGCAYVIMDDWGIDASDVDGQERNVLQVQDASRANVARVRLRLNNTGELDGSGKTYSWVIQVAGESDIVVSVGALSGLNGPSQVIESATSVAMHFKGASSYMAINGTQVGSMFDTTGLTARWLDLNPHGGDGPRGYGDYWSWGWTISGMTEAQTKAWVADRLAAAVA